MSINDLLDADLTTPVLAICIVIVIIAIIVIPLWIKGAKKADNKVYGDNESGVINVDRRAKIIARRTTPHPYAKMVAVNTIVFELSNGNRVELAIKNPNIYGIMVEGDYGILKYQGKRFISFERNGSNRD